DADDHALEQARLRAIVGSLLRIRNAIDPVQRIARDEVRAELVEIAVGEQCDAVERTEAKVVPALRADVQALGKVLLIDALVALRAHDPEWVGSRIGSGCSASQPIRCRRHGGYP